MGKNTVAAAHSDFYFAKDSLIQQLIHQLKHKSNNDISIYTGEMMGQSLNSNRFKNLDYLVPLPLYPDKERKRNTTRQQLSAKVCLI